MEAEARTRLREFQSPEKINGQLNKEGFEAPGYQAVYDHVARDRKTGGDLFQGLRRGGKLYRRRHTKGTWLLL